VTILSTILILISKLQQQQQWAARATPQRGCVGRHLANSNEMRVSGSGSYALPFLFISGTDPISLFILLLLLLLPNAEGDAL